jgi:hypothetical protein
MEAMKERRSPNWHNEEEAEDIILCGFGFVRKFVNYRMAGKAFGL